MDFDLDFLFSVAVMRLLFIVIVAIIMNALFGIFLAIKNDEFEFQLMPEFLVKGVFLYAGGLVVLALPANYIGQPYFYLYYVVAVIVLGKYLADIVNKVQQFYGIKLPG